MLAATDSDTTVNIDVHENNAAGFDADALDHLKAFAVDQGADIYGIPQDSEVRMFFYDKQMLRDTGKDEAFIEGLPAAVESG